MSAHERIDSLVKGREVVLFMKGSRQAPQCGFSAKVVEILDELLDDYETVDVLADPEVRQGIKEYSSWPTIPQLYVKSKFIGGCDIVREMHASGELGEALGKKAEDVPVPNVTVTESAAKAIAEHHEGSGKPSIRFTATAGFEYGLDFDDATASDIVIDLPAVKLVMNRATAKRANGVKIDYVTAEGSAGFKIEGPNDPPKVRQVKAADLKKWMDEGKAFELFDVRTESERQKARIGSAKVLDAAEHARLQTLDKSTPLVLFCHHGGRSLSAASQILGLGFKNVYNLAGGIEAWSVDADPTVPRY